MQIYTKWTSYNGEIGITANYDYYHIATAQQLTKEVHQGAIYYRGQSCSKRYSLKKINKTKKKEIVEIYKLPF